LVEIAALFRVGASLAATVFAPAPDEIQGWNQGFKLSVSSPLAEASRVSNGLLWAIHRRRSAYASFQIRYTVVHSRNVAAKPAVAADGRVGRFAPSCARR
jgi:hypothetical protein